MKSRRGDPPRVRVIAHRGSSRDNPENTVRAFDAAIRDGGDGLELDVQLSQDDVPVVFHDRTLRKAGGGNRRVDRTDLETLRTLNLDRLSREPRGDTAIPTLEEVLRRYRGRDLRLLLEMKYRASTALRRSPTDWMRTVARVIRRCAAEPDVLILCFDTRILDAASATLPDVPRVWNLRPPGRVTPRVAQVLDRVQGIGADVRSLSPAFGRAVRRRGASLFVYTCNTPRTVEIALEAEADGVLSDRTAWLADRLRRRGLR